MLAYEVHRCERLECWHVPGASHHHVWLTAPVVPGPRPDADPRCAVLDGGVHAEPLRRGLFAGNNDIYVIAAAQAMVRDREQRVRIGWEIDADNFGFLVDDVINEARVLMTESIVV